LLHYLAGNFQGSYNELLKYKLGLRSEVDPDMLFLEILNLIAQYQWKEAEELVVENRDLLGLSEDDVLRIFSAQFKYKNPEKAARLSYFLPGVGQWYAGYFFKGAFSGGIQAILGGFSIYSMVEGYVLTGSLTGVALFYTFYLGGVRHAKELADQRNLQSVKEMSKRFETACK
jgi:hypothetical protein